MIQNDTRHYSRCSIVGEETLRLYEWANVGGGHRLVDFEQKIMWLRESESCIELMHRGVPIHSGGTYCDFYGYLTSVEAAIRAAWEKAEHFKIALGGDLAAHVNVKVWDIPVTEDRDAAHENARRVRKAYQSVPSSGRWWFTSSTPIKGDELKRLPALERRLVEEVKPIYSTFTDPIGTIPERMTQWFKEQRLTIGGKSEATPT